MLRLKFRTKEIGPLEIEEEGKVTVLNEDTRGPETIPAKEAKGRRIILQLKPKDIREHDSFFLKAGYLRAMKLQEDTYKVRVPKKDLQIRELWEYAGSKASFDLSLVWDPLRIEELKQRKAEATAKTKEEDDLCFLTEEEEKAYWCGFASACVYFKEKSTGYLVFPIPAARPKEVILQNPLEGDVYNTAVYTEFLNFTLNCEGEQMYVQKLLDLKNFIEQIGLIQTPKMESLLRLYYLKSYKVSSIQKIKK